MGKKITTCRADGCNTEIENWMDFCKQHFVMLPNDIRDDLKKHKRLGSAKAWYEKREEAIEHLRKRQEHEQSSTIYT